MIIRVGLTGWSAWIVYVLVGTMQLVLIAFAIIFAIRDRGKPKFDIKRRHPSGSAVSDHFGEWQFQRGRNPASRSTRASNVALDETRSLLSHQPGQESL
jgi:hypothetical protein